MTEYEGEVDSDRARRGDVRDEYERDMNSDRARKDA